MKNNAFTPHPNPSSIGSGTLTARTCSSGQLRLLSPLREGIGMGVETMTACGTPFPAHHNSTPLSGQPLPSPAGGRDGDGGLIHITEASVGRMHKKLFPPNNPPLLTKARNLRRNMPEAERCLWRRLRGKQLNGYKFRRQQPIGGYIVDFICTNPRLIIEADGGQHAAQTGYDAHRTRYLEAQGFCVLRFWNHDILQQTDAVLTAILHKLEELNHEK